MPDLDDYLSFAKSLALEAGAIMMNYFDLEEKGIVIKDDETPVTLADIKINSLVISKVKEKYPNHGVLGEEESFNTKSENLWVVDPLDGTENFANQIPVFAFSMALVSGGDPKIAVVFDPVKNRLLSAISGRGAYDNDVRLSLTNRSSDRKLKISIWVVGGIENSVFDDATTGPKTMELFAKRDYAQTISTLDFPVAYSLALVGSGDFDGVISSIKTPWDVAAGCLIAQEVGAKVTDLFGNKVTAWDKEANGILVALPNVHAELTKIITPILEKAK